MTTNQTQLDELLNDGWTLEMSATLRNPAALEDLEDLEDAEPEQLIWRIEELQSENAMLRAQLDKLLSDEPVDVNYQQLGKILDKDASAIELGLLTKNYAQDLQKLLGEKAE